MGIETTGYNSTYKKLAVQWLNEVQIFNQTLMHVDSFVLRNRQLLIAANVVCHSGTDKFTSKKKTGKSLVSVRKHPFLQHCCRNQN
ncbi:hypothetical protein CEN47_03885 [Fischerella thermalis CCMEE 5319]|nr:hypothetical protein CEN47_03885 [Fischerella thermalis CCMEE 5319]